MNNAQRTGIIELIFTGFLALLGQVVLLRELLIAGFGVEMIYLLGLAAWMFWNGIGALSTALSKSFSPHLFRPLFVLAGAMIPGTLIFTRYSHILFGGTSGAFLPLGQQLALIILALFIPGLLLGFLFRLAAGRYIAAGGNLGKAYAWESLGSALGGITSTILLAFHISNYSQSLICMLVPPILVAPRLKSIRCCKKPLSIVWFLLLIIAFGISSQTDLLLQSWAHPSTLTISTVDTPYGRIATTREYGQTVVFINNALHYDTESVETEPLVHLAAACTDSIHDVLILGGGSSGILREVMKYQPDRVNYVEIDKMLVSQSGMSFPSQDSILLADPRVHTYFCDARDFLRRRELPFDLIVCGMPPPSSLQNNRYYTEDFFALVAKNLSSNGVFAFGMPSAENYWTPAIEQQNSSIYSAMQNAFTNTRVLAGQTDLYMGKMNSPFPDKATMIQRFVDAQLSTSLVTSPYLEYRITNERNRQFGQRLETKKVKPNTDLHPSAYGFTLQNWFSRFLPKLGTFYLENLSPRQSFLALFFILLLACVINLVIKRYLPSLASGIVLAFASGFIGMTLETVILIHYQVKYGILFGRIGLLLTAYMIGLSAGAWVISKYEDRLGNRIISYGLPVTLALLCVSLAFALTHDQHFPAFSWYLAQGIAGFLSGGLFSLAGRKKHDKPITTISPLYASDLLGGLLGATIITVLIIPLLGLSWPTFLAGIISLSLILLR